MIYICYGGGVLIVGQGKMSGQVFALIVVTMLPPPANLIEKERETSKQEILDKWLSGRPKVIQDMARKYPPWKEFVLKGQEELGTYTPLAYSENGTIRCLKRDWLGMEYQVFGMKPSTLKPAPTKLMEKEQIDE